MTRYDNYVPKMDTYVKGNLKRAKQSSEINAKLIKTSKNSALTKSSRHANMRRELLMSDIGYKRHMPWLRFHS